MSDPLDKSAELQEVILQSQIGVRKETGGLTSNGECHYCGEVIEQPKLFCNGECASQHDKFVTINGK